MKQITGPLKKVSVAEITYGTDIDELVKIARGFALPISFGVETSEDAGFCNSDEHKVLAALCDARDAGGFKTEMHLNGRNCSWFYFENCGNVPLERSGPNRVILNLNTISPEEYRWVLGRCNKLFSDTECYLLNSAETNKMLAWCIEELSLLKQGAKFLNFPGSFNDGWNMEMPLFGNVEDYDWCGGIDPNNVAPALDWIVDKYGYGSARIMTRGGVLTDKKTDLIKVGDFLERVMQWNSAAKAKLGQNLK